MATTPGVYKHNPSFVPQAPFLSDGALQEVLSARPILCVDILLVDYSRKVLLLPKRIRRPAEGLWFIGGMIKRNTPPLQAAAAVIMREAGTDIDQGRLEYVNASWFEWDYRQEEPQADGRVDFNLCFAFEPTADELERMQANLTDTEYDTLHGFRTYTRKQLEAALSDPSESPCKQVLLDYYDLLFAGMADA